MGRKLLIVESPAKAKTIKRYLGSDFDVRASVGHVRDLPVNDLGVDVAQGFEPKYVLIKDKEKVIRELKKAAARVEEVFLGPDPDREGEAIAWHIRQALGQKDKTFHRVLFHEITREAVNKALADPKPLDQNRFDSQQARRILDRLVGYNISPLLWDKVKRGLSAGRVQSVALRLIVERERDIWAFEPQEYWSLTALLAAAEPPPFEAKVVKVDQEKAELGNEAEVEKVVAALEGRPFEVVKVLKKRLKPRPAPPFITSTLQQEAFNKLGFAAAKTMRLAQRLYEGVDVGGEGAVGLITYMRTDSTRVIPQAQAQARDFIDQAFGSQYRPAKPPFYKSPKAAQEAHEAVRPTSVFRSPKKIRGALSKEMAALYELIWRRFLASQMAPAEVDRTSADIQAGRFTFRATGTKILFDGFRKVYGPDNDGESRLPHLAEGQKLDLKKLTPKQHFTQPPPRYTDASLVKEIFDNVIGRPSTYAAIMSTLLEKEYVKQQKGRFQPSDLGVLVSDLLVGSFPELMDVSFTAQMEKNLDRIEEGQAGWRETLNQFYGPFAQTLAQAKRGMADLKKKGLPTDLKCPNCGAGMVVKFGRSGQFLACSAYPKCKTTSDFIRDESGRIVPQGPQEVEQSCPACGRPMVERSGRFGRFLACSAYPECKTTKPLGRRQERPPDEPTEERCDKCGAPMVIKTSGRFGRFLACSAYPKCKNAKPIPTGVACPREGCGGMLAERVSKRGKVFFGCTNYPKCDYVLWQRPVAKPCPECGHPFLLRKELKAGPILACPQKGCGHKEPAQD